MDLSLRLYSFHFGLNAYGVLVSNIQTNVSGTIKGLYGFSYELFSFISSALMVVTITGI